VICITVDPIIHVPSSATPGIMHIVVFLKSAYDSCCIVLFADGSG
jgi:hypothetical protein